MSESSTDERDQITIPLPAEAWQILHDAAKDAGFVNRHGRVVITAFVRQLLAENPRVQLRAAQKPYRKTPNQVIELFARVKPRMKLGRKTNDETERDSSEPETWEGTTSETDR